MLPRVDHVENRWEPRGDQVGTRRVWFPPGPHVVPTWSPRGTHAQVTHSPQPCHSVLQLAASRHHIAMAPKRPAPGDAGADEKKSRSQPAPATQIVSNEQENTVVPVETPVGAQRQADTASIAAGIGAGADAGTLAVPRQPIVIRFPDCEAAAKALGGEQLRVLMEAVADEVGHLLHSCFNAENLPTILSQFAGIDAPAAHPPLDMPSGPTGSMKLTSYKDAWCDDKAARALGETGMYEAAANIMWFHAFRPGANPISGDPPTWATVVEIKDKEMVAAARAQVSVRGDVPRIVFPIIVPALVDSTSAARQATSRSCSKAERRFLKVLSCEAYVWSWYLAMWEALTAKDTTMVAALWQCGLTVTVHVRVNLTRAQQALWSIECSETNKAKERVCSDSFPAFSTKALFVLDGIPDPKAMKHLIEENVTFNGSKANKSMVAAILLFRDAFNADSLALLRAMENRHGKDMLTSGYVKLARIVQLCSEHAKAIGAVASLESTSDVVLYMLEYLDFALRVGMLTPDKMTVTSLDKTRDTVPGVLPVVFGRRFLAAHLATLVEDMRTVPTAVSAVRDLDIVLNHCSNYTMYEKAFGGHSASGAAEHVDATDVAESGNAGQPRSEDTGIIADCAVEAFKTCHGIKTKVGLCCTDFMFDLLAGTHDAIIKSALQNTGKDTPWGALEIPPWQELHRVLSLQRSVVAADDGAAPVASTRVLRRYASASERGDGTEGNAAGDDATHLRERADAWKQANGVRKKFVSIAVAKTASAESLQEQFQGCGSAYHAQGKAGTAHRVFLFSADLLGERQTKPWSTMTDMPTTGHTTNLITFLLKQTGPFDVLVFADGRNRASRLEIERQTAKMRHTSELFVIYKPTGRSAERGAPY